MLLNLPYNMKDADAKYASYWLLNSLPGMAVIVDEDMSILFANNSIMQVLDGLQEEITGMHIKSILHPDDIQPFLESIHKAGYVGEMPLKGVYRIRKGNGQYMWCECTFKNALNDPAVDGIVIAWHDITKYIDKEESLKRHNEELRKTNEQLDKFVYGVAHDLRAPLASILGIINYSELEVSDPETLNSFSLIKTSVNKLDNFIQDILRYSKNVKAGDKIERIEFRELLDDVVSNLRFMNGHVSNIAIKTEIVGDVPFYSNSNGIVTILNNLISNACRYYNPQSSAPVVEIHIASSPSYAKIIVRDNGIGIGEENLQKIFDMFFRISADASGSGLGLYMVKDTVEKLKGTIQVQSQLGEGTTFEVEIPNAI